MKTRQLQSNSKNTYSKFLYTLITFILIGTSLFGQNVEIQGNATITGTVEVMDTILFSDGTELASACLQVLQDGDGDTKIEVEQNSDEDIIRFTVEGNEIARFIDGRLEIQATGNSVFIGFGSGASDDGSANFITAVGDKAGESQTSGFANTYIGASAGNANQNGNENTYVGTSAGYKNTSNGNTMIGRRAGFENTSGADNTFLGNHAGHNNDGSGNVFLGNYAGQNEAGSNKLLVDNSDTTTPLIYGEFDNDMLRINGTLDINDEYTFPELNGATGQILSYDGHGALQWTNPSTSTNFEDGDGDTKIQVEETSDEDKIRIDIAGFEGLIVDSVAGAARIQWPSSKRNISIGEGVNNEGSTGYFNILIGKDVLSTNTSGTDNVMIGNFNGNLNTTGNNNVAIGNLAGYSITTGQENVYVGRSSGLLSNGSGNTMLGFGTGQAAGGSNNVYLGKNAGSINTGSGNVYIGHNAGSNMTGSGQLVIENSSSNLPLLFGNFGTNRLAINGTQTLGAANLTINDIDGGYGGVYINSGPNGLPFYGYAQNGIVKGYHYFDNSDKWIFYKGSTAMVLDASNNFGLGTSSPDAKMHVRGSSTNGHVMKIENTSNSQNADGLEIKINRTVTGLENNYVTFNDANSVAGRIEGFAIGEGPNFTDFPEIDFDFYFDIASIIAGSFEAGSFPYYDLNTLALPSFDPGDLGEIEGEFKMYPQNFVDNVLCLGNPFCGASNMKTVGYINVSNPTASPPVLDWDDFMWPDLVPGNLPQLDLNILLEPTVQTTAYADMAAIATWAFENGVEALSADPFHIALMQDPDYWSNMASWKHGGVTYGSKGADYAEWLEREDPSQAIKAGQIVGVKNGKISLNTEHADQIMAISVMPVVLGNMPDTTRQEDFEKVAFIGQTPVWVVGEVESGDYIIASGNNDGFGLPVSEDELTIDQVSQVVGRAWEDGKKMINLVNMAVGLKTNEMATILARTSKKVEEMEDRLTSIEAALGIGEIANK